MKYQKFIILILILILFFGIFDGAKITLATPIINEVNGILSDGNQITILGSGFGVNGPNVVLFDDFERGTHGSQVQLNLPEIGTWSGTNGTASNITYSNSTAISGNLALRFYCGNPYTDNPALQKIQTSTFQQFYISWWSIIPTDSLYPGEGNPDGKNWKIMWVGPDAWQQSDVGLWSNDYGWTSWGGNRGGDAVPMNDYYSYWNGTGWTQVDLIPDGRSRGTIGLKPDYSEDASFANGQWVRWQMWSVESDNPDTGRQMVWQTKSGRGTVQYRNNKEATWTTPYLNLNDRISVNGYVRNSESWPTFDDVYIAIGDSAQARIEIGDASTYTACTNLTAITPSSWSDGAISGTVRQGSFKDSDSAYLYVTDSYGVINSIGYPVTFRSASSDTIPPAAPSGFSIE